MTTSDREVVAALGSSIAQRIGEPRYRLWFHDKTRFSWEDGQLVVGVPNCFYQDWLQKKFGEEVRAAASDVLGQEVQVRFAIDPQLFRAARTAEAEQARDEGREARGETRGQRGEQEERSEGREQWDEEPEPTGTSSLRAPHPASPLVPRPSPLVPRPSSAPRSTRRWHRLTDFVVGPCNRLAHAAALSVVEQPAQGANPLVLHGPVGTGKTHLLEGIYAGLRRQYPDWQVRYETCEGFTNRFLHAMQHGSLAAFRKRFRECDVLLVDDLHFLAGKRRTQEEFLHTFDVLQADGKQIVLACDCHPRLADDYPPELTDRMLGGAVWGLTPPEASTRLDVLRAKSARGDPAVSEEVLAFLAGQLPGNVRELEGALHTLRHASRVAGRAIDLQLAREALADRLRHAVRVVQLADIDRAVCRVLRLEEGTLQSKQRAWAVSHPRMLAMYLARKHTTAAYSEIGQHFGGRNHSTAVAAEKKVRRWLQDNGELTIGQQHLRVRDLVDLVHRELNR